MSLEFSLKNTFRLKEVFVNSTGILDCKCFNYVDICNIVFLIKEKLELFNNCLIGVSVKKSALFVAICLG